MRAKTVNENQNFERGINKPSDLGIGRWKEPEDYGVSGDSGMKIPLKEFTENGGILEKGRDIWRYYDSNENPVGKYIKFYEKKQGHIISFGSSTLYIKYGTVEWDWNYFSVKVPTKIMYV